MNFFNKLIIFALGIMLIASVHARDNREYHKMVHDSGCKSCHDQGLKNYPSDESCSQCHDIDELAKKTARSEEDKWQNPHNNLHYGKELSCMECHGEHQKKAPLCNNCHTFNYEKHKN